MATATVLIGQSCGNQKNKDQSTNVSQTVAENGGKVKELNQEEFDALFEIKDGQIHPKTDKCMVVDLYATWCGPCKMMGINMDQEAQKYKGINFYKVDIDQCTVGQKLGISSIPFVFYFGNGKQEAALGYQEIAEIEDRLEEISKK